MLEPYFMLTCPSYKLNVFNGFSRLQQNQEFVDLTLAADGHFVKVHKNVIALASPYLKEMIKMASTQHPVIFLYDVSYKILCYLLEYIYQGEASIPENCVNSFIKVCKALQIVSINDESIYDQIVQNTANANVGHVAQPKTTYCTQTEIIQDKIIIPLPEPELPHSHKLVELQKDESFAGLIKIKSNHNVDVQQNLISMRQPNTNSVDVNDTMIGEFNSSIALPESEICMPSDCVQNIIIDDNMDSENTLTKNELSDHIKINVPPTVQSVSNESTTVEDLAHAIKKDKTALDAIKLLSQFSISERGSIQIIIGRYIYSSHHNSKQGRKHRWRCIDYRKLGCPAYIDSFDDKITLRHGIHNHQFHDRKICEKHKRRNIYHTYKRALETRAQGKS